VYRHRLDAKRAEQVERLDGEAACKLMESELAGVDFLPSDIRSLVNSPFFQGTYVAREVASDENPSTAGMETSLGMVSLWDGSMLTTFCITRFVFPASWYSMLHFRICLLACAGFVGLLWCRHIGGLFAAGCTAWGCGHVLAIAAGGFGLFKMRTLLWLVWVLLRNQDGDMKLRARLFGPAQKGPRGGELLGLALARAQHEAADLGFLSWICNLDTESPLRSIFRESGNFRTRLMHKSLVETSSTESKEALPQTSPLDFHDPRDI